MTTLTDAKLATLETLTGNTGHVQDLEREYLLLLVTGPVVANTIDDLWFQVFDEASIPAGHFNDRFYAYTGKAAPPRWARRCRSRRTCDTASTSAISRSCSPSPHALGSSQRTLATLLGASSTMAVTAPR